MKIRQITADAIFLALMIVGGFIKIPIPPVPITLQSVFAALSGIVLGAKHGGIVCLIYIALGISGLPIFASGGGISYVLNPSFGFIVGLAVQAWLSGKICEKKRVFKFSELFARQMLCIIPVYILGTAYYAFILNIYLNKAAGFWEIVFCCVLVFLPGDTLKCALCAGLGKKMRMSVRFNAK